jgi:hypothetical protein
MALQRMWDSFGHVLMSGLLSRGQRVRDLSGMAAFHPQRLGQMVSHRHGVNIQGFCNISRSKTRILFECLSNAVIQSLTRQPSQWQDV